MSQEDVREASGLSVTTISKIERGDPDLHFQRATMRRLDLALRWKVGTSEAWYEGRGGIVADLSLTVPDGISDETMQAIIPMVIEALAQQGSDPLTRTMNRFEPKMRRAILRALEVLADELDRP